MPGLHVAPPRAAFRRERGRARPKRSPWPVRPRRPLRRERSPCRHPLRRLSSTTARPRTNADRSREAHPGRPLRRRRWVTRNRRAAARRSRGCRSRCRARRASSIAAWRDSDSGRNRSSRPPLPASTARAAVQCLAVVGRFDAVMAGEEAGSQWIVRPPNSRLSPKSMSSQAGPGPAAPPGSGRIAVHRAFAGESRRRRGGRENRRTARRSLRRERRQGQVLDRDPAFSSRASRHGDLERGHMPDLAAPAGPPGEGEMPLLQDGIVCHSRGGGRKRAGPPTRRSRRRNRST